MAALTQPRMSSEVRINYYLLPLAAAQKVFRGGRACGDTSTGFCKKAAAGNANLLSIGEFAEDVDNTSGADGALQVNVKFDREIVAKWYDNATGANAVASSALFSDGAYWLDDHTVTTASSGNSKAGRVWGVDSVRGVLIEAAQGVSSL